MNTEKLLQDKLKSDLVLRGRKAIELREVLQDYFWLKEKKSLIRAGLTEALAEELKEIKSEKDKQKMIKLSGEYKKLEKEIKDLEQKEPENKKLPKLKEGLNDLKLELGGILNITGDNLSALIGYNSNAAEDMANIRKNMASHYEEIFNLLPQALRIDEALLEDMSLGEQEDLLYLLITKNKIESEVFFD